MKWKWKEGTYTTFAHPHRLGTPLVRNGTLKLEEPRVRQVTKPPIGRVVYIDLSSQYNVNKKKRNSKKSRCKAYL